MKLTKASPIITIIISMVVLLSGCGHHEESKALDKYIKTVKARPAKPVAALPTFKKYHPHEYQEVAARSPFMPAAVAKGGKNQPDLARPKQELERFPLDALRMVGVLGEGKTLWALVSAPDGTVYHVTKGAYLGKNYGQVKWVSDKELKLEETVPDGRGGWIKRPVEIRLTQSQ